MLEKLKLKYSWWWYYTHQLLLHALGSPERVCSLHLWGYSKLEWMLPWATCSGWPAWAGALDKMTSKDAFSSHTACNIANHELLESFAFFLFLKLIHIAFEWKWNGLWIDSLFLMGLQPVPALRAAAAPLPCHGCQGHQKALNPRAWAANWKIDEKLQSETE